MGWHGPSTSCGCCNNGTCCNNAWANVVALWSSLSASASGSGLSYSLSSSVVIENDSPTTCLKATAATECGPTKASVTYRINGPDSCPYDSGFDPTVLGTFKTYDCSSASGQTPITCNGVLYSSGDIYKSASISAEIYAACDADGVPYYVLLANLTYPLSGTLDCNLALPNCGYCLPAPVATLGYTADGFTSTGTPTHWSKANGTNQTSGIGGCSGGFTLPQGPSSDGGKYTYYSTTDGYYLRTTNLADFPTTINLSPLYNPASITGTVTLS